jgi:hypothetical protein
MVLTMINISEDRLRWLVRERKHLTLDGAVEIAKAAPDLLREMEMRAKPCPYCECGICEQKRKRAP